MKVYVLLEDWAIDYDIGDTIEVYNTLEKARKELEKKAKWAKNDMGNNDFLIEEIGENNYAIYEEGDYIRNHISIKIEERKVK